MSYKTKPKSKTRKILSSLSSLLRLFRKNPNRSSDRRGTIQPVNYQDYFNAVFTEDIDYNWGIINNFWKKVFEKIDPIMDIVYEIPKIENIFINSQSPIQQRINNLLKLQLSLLIHPVFFNTSQQFMYPSDTDSTILDIDIKPFKFLQIDDKIRNEIEFSIQILNTTVDDKILETIESKYRLLLKKFTLHFTQWFQQNKFIYFIHVLPPETMFYDCKNSCGSEIENINITKYKQIFDKFGLIIDINVDDEYNNYLSSFQKLIHKYQEYSSPSNSLYAYFIQPLSNPFIQIEKFNVYTMGIILLEIVRILINKINSITNHSEKLIQIIQNELLKKKVEKLFHIIRESITPYPNDRIGYAYFKKKLLKIFAAPNGNTSGMHSLHFSAIPTHSKSSRRGNRKMKKKTNTITKRYYTI